MSISAARLLSSEPPENHLIRRGLDSLSQVPFQNHLGIVKPHDTRPGNHGQHRVRIAVLSHSIRQNSLFGLKGSLQDVSLNRAGFPLCDQLAYIVATVVDNNSAFELLAVSVASRRSPGSREYLGNLGITVSFAAGNG